MLAVVRIALCPDPDLGEMLCSYLAHSLHYPLYRLENPVKRQSLTASH